MSHEKHLDVHTDNMQRSNTTISSLLGQKYLKNKNKCIPPFWEMLLSIISSDWEVFKVLILKQPTCKCTYACIYICIYIYNRLTAIVIQGRNHRQEHSHSVHFSMASEFAKGEQGLVPLDVSLRFYTTNTAYSSDLVIQNRARSVQRWEGM